MNTEQEFSCNVFLGETDRNRFQFVYATQLYGSFFGLYASFNCEEDREKQGHKIINSISFQGITYKGLVNFKIDSISQPKITAEAIDGRNFYQIDLFLKAGFGQPRCSAELVIEKPNDFSLKPGDYIRILRGLAPLHETTVNVGDDAFSQGLFDEEHYDRDGLYIKKKDGRDFNDGDIIAGDVLALPRGFKWTEEGILVGSIKCTPSDLKVIF
jgi:hypothetical protein